MFCNEEFTGGRQMKTVIEGRIVKLLVLDRV
jgi:hypothetical protein